MKLTFQNKHISGILTIIPTREVVFEEEIENYNFSRGQSMKLKLIMGYNKRRIVANETCISDLCIYGLEYLFEENLLENPVTRLFHATHQSYHTRAVRP